MSTFVTRLWDSLKTSQERGYTRDVVLVRKRDLSELLLDHERMDQILRQQHMEANPHLYAPNPFNSYQQKVNEK